MPDLSRRQNQIVKSISDINLPEAEPTEMAIQEHAADKAGMHYDIRFNINGKAVSFATKKGLPEAPGAPRLLIRQPDHVIDYMNWEGTIPKGEYGAGSVKLYDKQPVVITQTDKDKLHIHIPKGPNSGNFTIFKTNDDKWLAVKNKELPRTWESRPDYKKATRDLADMPEDLYMASRKYDGAHFIADFTDKGVALTSQNLGVSGSLIPREDNYPHLKYTKIPKDLVGTVLRGELHHPKGFNILSAMTIANPVKSLKMQQEHGKPEFIPFEVVRYQGKDFSQFTPEERIKIVDDVANAIPNSYIKPPERKRASESLRDFYERVVANNGEGIVLQDRTTGEFLKKKNRLDYDLKIKDVLEGDGRLKGSMGSLVLIDNSDTEVGNVGTGFSDALRKEIFENKNKYIGQLVKITSDKPVVAKSLRGPAFAGFTIDKSTPDLL